jgi:hypothetical protein
MTSRDIENIEKFKNTLDFKYYDILPDRVKELFYEVSIEILRRIGEPTPMMTIIGNHGRYRKEDFPPIRRVIGPVSYHKIVWNNPNDPTDFKIFHLFGDIHIHRPNCPRDSMPESFNPLLLKHIMRSDKIIDVFIERPHKKQKKFSLKSEFIDRSLRTTFEETNPLESIGGFHHMTGETVKNARLHEANVRSLGGLDEPEGFLSEMDRVSVKLAELKRKNIDIKTFWRNAQPFFEDVRQLVNKSQSELIKEIDNDPIFKIIRKQLEHIKDLNIKQFLFGIYEKQKRYIMEIFMYIQNSYKFNLFPESDDIKRIAKRITKRGIKVYEDERDEEIEKSKFLDTLGTLTSKSFLYIMDMYFFGRCFRDFEVVKDGMPKNSPKYIIAFFGDTHIQSIVEVLTRPPFNATIERNVDRVEKGETGYQCLDLGITTPLFP